jgi:hypothetical protein
MIARRDQRPTGTSGAGWDAGVELRQIGRADSSPIRDARLSAA